jgi:putative ABC transport system permease protein
MYWFRRFLLWIPGRRRVREQELEEELQADLAMAIEDAAESGLPRDEAEQAARRAFGNLTRAREEARAVWFPGWDAFSQDLRFALRMLARTPVFSVVAILSLALGTGAATALFSLVNTITLKPLSYREPGQLVFVREVVPPLAHIYPTMPVNLQHFRFWREQTRAFDAIAAVSFGDEVLFGDREPEVIGSVAVSANLFDVLGVRPQIGRTFLADEEKPGNRVVVITDGLWRRRFGAAPDIAGQTILLGGAKYVIAGVLPASFHFPKNTDLGSLTMLAERTDIFFPIQGGVPGWGGDYDYVVFGRLRHSVTLQQGAAELNLFERRIAEEHGLPRDLHVEARPLQEVMASPVRTGLTVLLAAVLVLVLLVCVNLANLLLARSSARSHEFALRMALGASRARMLAAALTETLLLALAGGVLGAFAASAALSGFIHAAPVDLPRLDEVQMDGRVFAFVFALSLFCGLLFGLLPALRLSRTDPQAALRGLSRMTTTGRRGLRLREWLVSGEVALTTILLVLAGLLVSSLWHVLRVERGFTEEHALDIALSFPSRYQEGKERRAFLELAVERLRALPGVRAAAVASKVPLTGESNVNTVQVHGSEVLDPTTRQLVMVNVRFISQDYFAALGIPLVRGRSIEAADRDRGVAVISARLAAKLWPNRNPLGEVLKTGSGVGDATVVGVVADVHSTRLDRDPTLIVYVPFWKRLDQASHLVVRAAADPRAVASDIRRSLQVIDPAMPAPKMRTMGDIVEESMAQRRFQMRVASAFAMAALLLAGLGIYGVVAYGISLRRHEFGIRMALGAKISGLCWLVVWRGLRPVVLGLAAGVVIALAAGRFVRTLLFEVTPIDGPTLAAVAAALACVALLACLMPTRSVVVLDPARILRDE